MVANLAKTPLTAVLFAALYCFVAPFMPFSQAYADVISGFTMPLMGYAFIVAYWLFISIIIVLIFGETRYKGIKMVLFTLLSLLGTVWATPLLHDFWFGETTGAMSRFDLIMQLARYAGTGILLLVLGMMLFRRHEEPQPAQKPATPPKPEPKFHIKKLDLIIKFLVLPVIYMVIYFLVWYFVLWRSEAVRTYFGAADPTEYKPFNVEIINMLLNDIMQLPEALAQGLVYALLFLPLLLQMAGKRVMFIITSVLLLLAPAVQMLIPSAIMPDDVRISCLIFIAIIAVAYGGLGSFLLSMSLIKEAPPPEAPKQNLTPAQVAAMRAAQAAKKAAGAEAAAPPAK